MKPMPPIPWPGRPEGFPHDPRPGTVWESKSTSRFCVVIGRDPEDYSYIWVKFFHTGSAIRLRESHLLEQYEPYGVSRQWRDGKWVYQT